MHGEILHSDSYRELPIFNTGNSISSMKFMNNGNGHAGDEDSQQLQHEPETIKEDRYVALTEGPQNFMQPGINRELDLSYTADNETASIRSSITENENCIRFSELCTRHSKDDGYKMPTDSYIQL